MAIEKLDGTNVSIVIENGTITSIWNRTGHVPFFNKGKRFIVDGLQESYSRGYISKLGDGQHFGELIGKKVNGNPYQLDYTVWIPFKTFSHKRLSYKSWGKYPKTFEAIPEWFENLMPLYSMSLNHKPDYVEGVVFTHTDGRMAKLRKDMFEKRSVVETFIYY